MIDGYARGLTLAAAIGAGVTAGVYFAFSTFIMTGLRRLSHAQSIAAMNAINKAAPNPLFMLALFGTAIACVILAVHGLRHRDAASFWLILGCGLYIISALVTVIYHVPHNDALMTVDPNAAGAGITWSQFVTPWLAWNHVRTVTSVAGTVSLVLALRAPG
jgi:uncharacterized membrane protein